MAVNHGTAKPVARRGLATRVSQLAKTIARIALSPLRLFLSIRASMTASSVTLLLIGIVSMNIVWGYPWTGMFSVCASLMLVGWGISRLMRPNLKLSFSLPNSAPAGEPFAVVTHTFNASRLPAMDLTLAFARKEKRGRNWRLGRRRRSEFREKSARENYSSLSQPHVVPLIHPSERVDLRGSLVFDRRGIHPLPELIATSTFPFHLFRSTRHYPSKTSIAVTPRLMTGEEDAVARGMLKALGGWSHRLLSGDALDYTGSREYEVGMPVRRWDFSSWARLGRPIVREFQSPSVQTVMLFIDTCAEVDPPHGSNGVPILERTLSLGATAVTELCRRMVRVGMFVTSESPSNNTISGMTQIADMESLLIRLAAAESVSRDVADARLQSITEHASGCPILVLTPRSDLPLQQNAPANVSFLHVDASRTGTPENLTPVLSDATVGTGAAVDFNTQTREGAFRSSHVS